MSIISTIVSYADTPLGGFFLGGASGVGGGYLVDYAFKAWKWSLGSTNAVVLSSSLTGGLGYGLSILIGKSNWSTCSKVVGIALSLLLGSPIAWDISNQVGWDISYPNALFSGFSGNGVIAALVSLVVLTYLGIKACNRQPRAGYIQEIALV